MTRSYVVLLSYLALAWGGSYMFIKLAVEDLSPAVTMAIRLLIAAALLLAFLLWRSGARSAAAELVAARRPGLVLGVLNAAVPFTLIAWGEQHIDSGVAAIANASVPIFNVLLAARFLPSERVGGSRLAGVVVGFVGVGVLAGVRPEGGSWAVAGTLAVVLASLSYAAGGIYGQVRVSRTAGPVLATASMLAGALVLVPLALASLPSDAPGWKAVGAVVALAVLGTAAAQLVLFRMLRLHGSARVSLVTYLLPPIALVYGAVLLDEAITWQMVAGLVLILGGVALGAGLARLPRREPAPATPQP